MSRRTARVVGGLGRTLVAAGLLTLLFVVYQLWGTGIQQSRAQDRLDDRFDDLLAATAELRDDPDAATTTTDPSDGSSTSTSAVTTTTEPIDPAVLAALAPVLGEPLGRIQIPAIGVDVVMVHGVRVSDLRRGPGHFPSTPLPGQEGNASIAGHRTTYGQPFHDIDLLVPGDEIIVTTLQGTFTYDVMAHPAEDGAELGHFIVRPNQVEILDDHGDNRITLVACHPKFSSRQRIVVTGLLREEPVEPPPTIPEPRDDEVELPDEGPEEALPQAEPEDGFGEGLDGDPGALTPTLMWGAVFGLGFLAAWSAGRAWRRWPAYLIAFPFLARALYSCFVYLDQYLPSY